MLNFEPPKALSAAQTASEPLQSNKKHLHHLVQQPSRPRHLRREHEDASVELRGRSKEAVKNGTYEIMYDRVNHDIITRASQVTSLLIDTIDWSERH